MANTFSGEVVINSGALVIDRADQLGSGTSVISVNGVGNTGNPGFSGGSLVLDGTQGSVNLTRDVSVTGRGPGAANASGALISIGYNTLGVKPRLGSVCRC